MLKSRRVYSPVPIGIGHDRSFHAELSFHGVRRIILNHVNLMIICVSVIGSEIDIPFAIDIAYFRIPEVMAIRRIFRHPDLFTSGMSHIGNIGGYPQIYLLISFMGIIIFTIMVNRA